DIRRRQPATSPRCGPARSARTTPPAPAPPPGATAGRAGGAETSEESARAPSGGAWLVGGGVIAVAAVVGLVVGGVYGLSELMQPGWAALIVGGAALLVGLLAMAAGRSRLKARNMMPQRTFESLRRDADVAARRVQ